jgi:hypothetical protein
MSIKGWRHFLLMQCNAMQCKHVQAIILLEDNEYDEGLDKSHKACVKHK